MKPISKIVESDPRYRMASKGCKLPEMPYARLKQEWQIQVSQDSQLPPISHRIALALPKWLNSKNLTAWPAQSTIATFIGVSKRTVGSGFKALRQQGHIIRLNDIVGGRYSDQYRIVLLTNLANPVGISSSGLATLDEEGKEQRGKGFHLCEEDSFTSGRKEQSPQPRTISPLSGESCFQQTKERTKEQTLPNRSELKLHSEYDAAPSDNLEEVRVPCDPKVAMKLIDETFQELGLSRGNNKD